MNTVTVHTSAKRSPAPLIPQLDPQARIAALRRIRGMWKDRDIKKLAAEFRHIRKELDRKLP